MKHLSPLAKHRPARAALWQDVVCGLASTLVALLTAFGTSSPTADFVDGKCAIPTPNPEGGGDDPVA